MSISIIGTPQAGSAINGGNVTLTFSTTPSQNDMALVIVGTTAQDEVAPGVSTSGYTTLATHTGSGGGKPGIAVLYKVMGASPDSNVVCTGDGHFGTGTCAVAYILREIDTSTPSDQTPTTAGESSGANPDPAAITTQTDEAWVFACACSTVYDTSPGTISGYSNHYSAAADDTRDTSICVGTKEVATAGSEDPDAFSSWSSGFWYTITVAIRPAGAAGGVRRYYSPGIWRTV